MKIPDFHTIVDSALEDILLKYKDDKVLNKHKDVNQNKGYAFLIWFLEFYGQKALYKNYITEGSDDYSCDIIFSSIDSQNRKVFYIIQSKWINFDVAKSKKDYPSIKSEEFNASLNDFRTILSGSRTAGKNERFNKKHEELIAHLEQNGTAKFIFFTLAKHNDYVTDSITAFNKDYAPNITLEVIDANRIRKDYISFKFKGFYPNNPLEYKYNPENSEILLDIVRYAEDRDFLAYQGREQAYIFLLKPATVHRLFEKFKYSLFFKNVRNPLPASNYNKQIVETLKTKPNAFWYFNNGITAITKVIPDIGKHANVVTLNGLQVINGAQTVYSIYSAYEEATAMERKIMDADVRVSLRLIRSSDEDFNLEITKYTNSQNPMHDRDFVANDAVQKRLQEASFETNYWYETRRGEFIPSLLETQVDTKVTIVPNQSFALAYMAFHLQRPIDAAIHEDKFFVSHKEHKDGLYERIFNEETSFEDMLASFLLWDFYWSRFNKRPIEKNDRPYFLKLILIEMSFSKVVLVRYLALEHPQQIKSINISAYLIDLLSNSKLTTHSLLQKIVIFSSKVIFNKVPKNDELGTKYLNKLFTSPSLYERIKEDFEESNFSVDDIDSISLDGSGIFHNQKK